MFVLSDEHFNTRRYSGSYNKKKKKVENPHIWEAETIKSLVLFDVQ